MSAPMTDEYALILGICIGALHKNRDFDALKVVLQQPCVKAIARSAPERMLAGLYKEMDMSFEETN